MNCFSVCLKVIRSKDQEGWLFYQVFAGTWVVKNHLFYIIKHAHTLVLSLSRIELLTSLPRLLGRWWGYGFLGSKEFKFRQNLEGGLELELAVSPGKSGYGDYKDLPFYVLWLLSQDLSALCRIRWFLYVPDSHITINCLQAMWSYLYDKKCISFVRSVSLPEC